MHNYKVISKNAIIYHKNALHLKKQIEALTVALVGAIGKGHKVSSIGYQIDELKKVDLTEQIKVFERSKKTVPELEEFLYEKYDEIKKTLFLFRNERDQLTDHYNMCPKCFLSHFLTIKKEDLIKFKNTEILEKYEEFIIFKKIKSSALSIENEIMVFFGNDDFEKIKDFFQKEFSIECNQKNEYVLNEKNEEFLQYLYI